MLLNELNDRQREAVQYTEGPLLILAGAGSGKTRVLTHRIAYLIAEKKVEPYNIMAITFTNKAADEMRERVDRIVGDRSEEVWVATFHSSCVRILRRYIDRLGYDNSFTIYDADDQKTLIKNIFKSLNIDTHMLKEKTVMRVISSCKDELMTAEEYQKEAADYKEEQIARVYVEYQKQLRKNNALDFDDLIVKTVELFETNADVLENYQHRFRYIMVDEYQDTNNAQFRLIELLASSHHNICVVGDDDQSIYKFRGANIENILSFESVYPDAKVVKLEQNYRSTGNILNAANKVIAHNRGRKDKTLWTAKDKGNKVILTQYSDAPCEAYGVVSEIRNAVNGGGFPESGFTGSEYSDYAVLYRTNAQSRLLEEKCVAFGVPYQLIGGVNFYQRKEIKDALAYLKTIANGRDDIAAKRIINVPKRGIGAATVSKIDAEAAKAGISFYDECRLYGNAKVDRFVELIEDYRKKLNDGMTIADIIDSVVNETGYREELEEEGEVESEARLENLGELISKAAEYESAGEFLEDVALIADIDRFDDASSKITLMTLHAAKGLEFPVVYMTGLEEGLFPSSMSINSDDRAELEEERRLCYVGITRARERLNITFARSRMVNGESHWSKASRFVEEIPDELLEKHLLETDYRASGLYDEDGEDYDFGYRRKTAGFDPGGSAGGGPKDVRAFAASTKRAASRPKPEITFGKEFKIEKALSLDYDVGDRVTHMKFGDGTVTGIVNGSRDYEVTVEFDDFGTRTLLAGFAKLEKI